MRRWVKTTAMYVPDDAIKAAREFVSPEVANLIMQPGETVAEWSKRVGGVVDKSEGLDARYTVTPEEHAWKVARDAAKAARGFDTGLAE